MKSKHIQKAGKIAAIAFSGIVTAIIIAAGLAYATSNELRLSDWQIGGAACAFAILYMAALSGGRNQRIMACIPLSVIFGAVEGFILFPLVFDDLLNVPTSLEARAVMSVFMSALLLWLLVDTLRVKSLKDKELEELRQAGIVVEPVSGRKKSAVVLPYSWADMKFGSGKVAFQMEEVGDLVRITVQAVGLTGSQFKDQGGLLKKLQEIEGISWQRPANDAQKHVRVVTGTATADLKSSLQVQLGELIGLPTDVLPA